MGQHELKPCPFCGSVEVEAEDHPTSPERMVACGGCGCGAFVSDWNTRPGEDRLAAEVAALKEQNATGVGMTDKMEEYLAALILSGEDR